MQLPVEARNGFWIPWIWSYNHQMWFLGLKLRSSERVVLHGGPNEKLPFSICPQGQDIQLWLQNFPQQGIYRRLHHCLPIKKPRKTAFICSLPSVRFPVQGPDSSTLQFPQRLLHHQGCPYLYDWRRCHNVASCVGEGVSDGFVLHLFPNHG